MNRKGYGNKRKRFEEKPKVEGEFDLPAKHMKAVHVEPNKKRLIVILHGAQLETVKVIKFSSREVLKLIQSCIN
jgi:hypothetical protein